MATAADTGSAHRQRLLEGLAASLREKGYRATSVADVVRHARVSRRTFYEHFADKDACFIELVVAVSDHLLDEVGRAVDPGAPWSEQVDQAVDGYMGALAVDPALTLSVVRELPALGEKGAAVRRRGHERFAELCVRFVADAARRGTPIAELSMDTALMLTGGLDELVVRAVERDEDPARLAPVAKDVWKAVLDPARTRPRG